MILGFPEAGTKMCLPWGLGGWERERGRGGILSVDLAISSVRTANCVTVFLQRLREGKRVAHSHTASSQWH